MGTVADGNLLYNNNPSPSAEEGLLMLRENQEAFRETLGVMPPEVLVIKDGTISPTTAICNVRTEGDASVDDITTIIPTLSNGTRLHDGMILFLSAKDASQRITLKNSAGQNGVVTTNGKDIVLSTKWYVILQFVENKWNQIDINIPLPVASSTTIGGIKPQTGNSDGLELEEDGTMRVRNANSTQRGSVLASETAKTGAVPQAGEGGDLDLSWSLGKIWIGVPRYWRSTNLPPAHCWANGDFVAFADWPELRAVYDAGGFAGMLMDWDADSATQAANLGQWRPDAADPTGLYTPNLNGQFLRGWTPASGEAGRSVVDTGRSVTGSIIIGTSSGALGTRDGEGALMTKGSSTVLSGGGSGMRATFGIKLDSSKSWGNKHTGEEFAPQHVYLPMVIYLGLPS